MNISSEQLQEIATTAQNSQRILICITSSAKTDECAAALGLARLLSTQSKDVRIISPTTVQVSENEVPGVGEITSEVGKDNLVVSFEYSPEQVDKVSYHIGEETGRFYLTIKPKKGVKPLSTDNVVIEYAGASADMVVFIGVASMDQLEPFSSEFSDLFSNAPSLSLTKSITSEVGRIKLECEGMASISEEVAQLAMQLGWDMEGEAATALLRGIELATDWLASPATTAQTFETVAALIRAGARRLKRPTPKISIAATTPVAGTQAVSLAEAMRARTATLQQPPKEPVSTAVSTEEFQSKSVTNTPQQSVVQQSKDDEYDWISQSDEIEVSAEGTSIQSASNVQNSHEVAKDQSLSSSQSHGNQSNVRSELTDTAPQNQPKQQGSRPHYLGRKKPTNK